MVQDARREIRKTRHGGWTGYASRDTVSKISELTCKTLQYGLTGTAAKMFTTHTEN
jgi:hypothetical protein